MVAKPGMVSFLVMILLLFGCGTVTIKSNDDRIVGAISKPDGNGPLPALVLMHGCGGPQPGNGIWARELNSWGYVTMEVDSFYHRGIREICSNLRKLTVSERVVDAYAALDHLKTQPYVDKGRIAVMDWSHGGMVVLSALWTHRRPDNGGFKAGVAMYPWCEHQSFYAPLLIIVGSADDWTPSSLCTSFRNSERVELHIYEGVWHSFDNPGPMRTYLGHQLGYNHPATVRARKDVREFLKRNL